MSEPPVPCAACRALGEEHYQELQKQLRTVIELQQKRAEFDRRQWTPMQVARLACWMFFYAASVLYLLWFIDMLMYHARPTAWPWSRAYFH